MKNADYWKKRAEEVANRQFATADAYERALRKEYDLATNEIKKQVEAFYARYADENGVTLAEARKNLSDSSRNAFQLMLEQFIELAKNNEDGRWTQTLNEAYYRSRITRFEQLMLEIQNQIEQLKQSQKAGTDKTLGNIYDDAYHRTLFELQKGTGIVVSFAKVNQGDIDTVLKTEFAGDNYSKRIYKDKLNLMDELKRNLMQSFIRGDSIQKTTKIVEERMGVSKSNASRLIQTEAAFFAGEGTHKGYVESGVVDQYEILATLYTRTSDTCRGLDGKVFPLSEKETGTTYPPFHARCRTTTVVFFDDEVAVGVKSGTNSCRAIARDEKRIIKTVPSTFKYEQWNNLFVTKKTEREMDSSLLGVRTPNGITISKISYHSIERTIKREIEVDLIVDALINPLKVSTIKNGLSGSSQEFIGEFVRVNVNPDDGTLITLWRTSTKLSRKLKGLK